MIGLHGLTRPPTAACPLHPRAVGRMVAILSPAQVGLPCLSLSSAMASAATTVIRRILRGTPWPLTPLRVCAPLSGIRAGTRGARTRWPFIYFWKISFWFSARKQWFSVKQELVSQNWISWCWVTDNYIPHNICTHTRPGNSSGAYLNPDFRPQKFLQIHVTFGNLKVATNALILMKMPICCINQVSISYIYPKHWQDLSKTAQFQPTDGFATKQRKSDAIVSAKSSLLLAVGFVGFTTISRSDAQC